MPQREVQNTYIDLLNRQCCALLFVTVPVTSFLLLFVFGISHERNAKNWLHVKGRVIRKIIDHYLNTHSAYGHAMFRQCDISIS